MHSHGVRLLIYRAPILNPRLFLPLLLLQRLLQLSRLKVNLHVSLVEQCFTIFVLLILDVWLQLHKSINIVLETAHHVFFQKQIIGGSQVIVLVVPDTMQQAFLVEFLL